MRVFWCALTLSAVMGMGFVANAQLLVGAGVRLQSDVPYTVFLLQSHAQVAELAWADSNRPVTGRGYQLSYRARLYAVLVRWQFDLGSPFNPYIALGGISALLQLSGLAEGKPVGALASTEGIQGGAGVVYQQEDQPLSLFANVLYSMVPLPVFEINQLDKPIAIQPAIKGIDTWSWSVGAQFSFNLTEVFNTLDSFWNTNTD